MDVGGDAVRASEATRLSLGVADQVADSEYSGTKPLGRSKLNPVSLIPTTPTEATTEKFGSNCFLYDKLISSSVSLLNKPRLFIERLFIEIIRSGKLDPVIVYKSSRLLVSETV